MQILNSLRNNIRTLPSLIKIDKFIYLCILLYIMAEIKVNIAFRNTHEHKDTLNRSDHVFDRMKMRGITKENIKEAVQKGAKHMREDKSIVAEFRWFKVIYREFQVDNIRKIYPITVID